MSESNFFIRRPIFATVISIVIVLAGIIASQVLPVAQYPEIAPPTVTITASYPGASAETLARTVAAPIEEQLNGVEGLLYHNSSSSSNGTVTITATFKVGQDGDKASIDVSNKVKIAEARLPEEVRRNGINVQKRSNDILLVVALRSDKPDQDALFLSNYASLNLVDELKREAGVGDVSIFGARDYSMRIWLKPDRMAQLGLTTTDIASAIRAQNAQYAAGKIGQEPVASGQQLVYTVTAQGRLNEAEDFGNIILRSDAVRGVLRLKEVATIELGAQNYDAFTRLDGKPAIGIAVFLQTGANALDTAERIEQRMAVLKERFPDGVEYLIPFNTTRFVKASINEVVATLLEAAVLVVLVVFIFLQNWRATLIPILAVPVSLIGTFAGLWAFGFSINTLTLFAMVLSIGIVVDDAIVVLENVERLMSERGMSPRAAAFEAMREVSGAVVAIVLVLCAVFVPVAFLGGIAGTLYQQFAVTVAISVVISGIVALTLTPALCALLLKPGHKELLLFRPFNWFFERLTRGYLSVVRFTLRFWVVGILMLGLVGAGTYYLYRLIPGSFVPSEDQGYVISALMLPDGATLERTGNTGELFRQQIKDNPAIEHVFSVAGFDLIGGGNKSSAGTMFVPLKPWEERTTSAEALAGQMMGVGMGGLRDGIALAFNPPPIRGLGSAGGFEAYIQSRQDSDPQKLAKVIQDLIGALSQDKSLTKLNTFFRPTTPQLYVDVDREKVLALDVPIATVFDTLQSTMGSLYVNDFNKFGRTYRVQLQADALYRSKPEDLGKVYVRSNAGKMIPMSALIQVNYQVGPEQLERYNGFLAAKLMGEGAVGVSSMDAIHKVEQVAAQVLPEGYQLQWTGQAYQEKSTGNASTIAFGFAIIMVFLILAAQFERWSLPIAVMLSLPFAILGALVAIHLRAMPNDIYFQIGMLTLLGLAAKNAILIVEFASQKVAEGLKVREAALEAARLRFRPIVMTSLAFVLGVVPLVWASGAGAAARRSMGTGVFGGMLAATFIATLFIPLFFSWLSRNQPKVVAAEDEDEEIAA